MVYIMASPEHHIPWYSAVFFVTGNVVFLLACIGVFVLPELYTRIHAAGKLDTVGLFCFAIGLALMMPGWSDKLKILSLAAAALVVPPVVTHALGRAAYLNRRSNKQEEASSFKGMVFLALLGPVGIAISGLRAKDMIAGSLALGVFSLFMAIGYALLGSGDVALTEIVINGAFASIITINVIYMTCRTDHSYESGLDQSKMVWFRREALVQLAFVGVICLLLWANGSLAPFGSPMSPAATGVASFYMVMSEILTNTVNVVTAILAYFRGYDTFGEAIVTYSGGLVVEFILFSVASSVAYKGMSDTFELGMAGPKKNQIARYITLGAVPFVLVFGSHVFFGGHSTIGGGFQSGGLLGLAVIMPRIILGQAKGQILLKTAEARVGARVGLLITTLAGITPMFYGGAFLEYEAIPWLGADDPTRIYWGIMWFEAGVVMIVACTFVRVYDMTVAIIRHREDIPVHALRINPRARVAPIWLYGLIVAIAWSIYLYPEQWAFQLAIGIVGIGFAGMAFCNNMLKKAFASSLLTVGGILWFHLIAWKIDAAIPIYDAVVVGTAAAAYLNPVPMVLMLTAIVVSIILTAEQYALIIVTYVTFGTIEEDWVHELMQEDRFSGWNKLEARGKTSFWPYLLAVFASGALLSLSLVAAEHVINHGSFSYFVAGRGLAEYQGRMIMVGIELKFDHLAVFFLVIVNAVTFMVILGTRKVVNHDICYRQGMYYELVLLLAVALSATAISWDGFNLYVCIELITICAVALLAVGRMKAPVAAFRYAMLSNAGAWFILIGIGYLYAITGTLNIGELYIRLAVIDNPAKLVALIFILAGTGLKMGMVPIHGWLPDAYSYTSSSTSSLVSAIVGKGSGIIIMMRMVFWVFGSDYVREMMVFDVLLGFGLVGMWIASLRATQQQDLKRVLAYSSVYHMSFILVCLCVAPEVAVFHMLVHAFVKSGLFQVVSAIEYRTRRTRIDLIAGTAKMMPVVFLSFGLLALTIIGLPFTAGIVSKWQLLTMSMFADLTLAIRIALVFTLIGTSCIAFFYYIFQMAGPMYSGDIVEERWTSDSRTPVLTTMIVAVVVFLIAVGIHYNVPIMEKVIWPIFPGKLS